MKKSQKCELIEMLGLAAMALGIWIMLKVAAW